MLELGGMKLYDVQDLSMLLSLHEKTVRSLLRKGVLRGKKLAKKWYVTEDSLRTYFEIGDSEQHRESLIA